MIETDRKPALGFQIEPFWKVPYPSFAVADLVDDCFHILLKVCCLAGSFTTKLAQMVLSVRYQPRKDRSRCYAGGAVVSIDDTRVDVAECPTLDALQHGQ